MDAQEVGILRRQIDAGAKAEQLRGVIGLRKNGYVVPPSNFLCRFLTYSRYL